MKLLDTAIKVVFLVAMIMSTIHLRRIADALEILATPIGGA